MATLKLSATTRARYERRNNKRRKVHLANGDTRAACGAHGNAPLTLINGNVTCATCRDMLAKGGAL